MGALSVVSCVVVLWMLLGVGGTMQNDGTEGRELQRSFKDDTSDLQLFTASQPSTSKGCWDLLVRVVVAIYIAVNDAVREMAA